MSAAQVGVVAALLVAGALGSLGRAVATTPRSLSAARARLAGNAPHSGLRAGTGAMTRFIGDGLSLTGLTPEVVVGRAMTAAVVAGFASLVAIGALAAMGGGPPPLVALGVVMVAVVGAGWTMAADARTKARRAHADLRRSTNDLIQLVAIGLTTDQSVEEAIRFALETVEGSESSGSDLLRSEIAAAPMRGEPIWEAIDRIGREHHVRELSEFAHSLERQATHGVSIGATVAALAAGMRARALDHLEREADRANANLAGPTAGFVVATLVFLAYPLAVRISEAFGG